MPETCGHVTVRLKSSESMSNPNQEVKISKPKIRAKDCLFWSLFDPPIPQPSPIITQIGTCVEHYAIYIIALTKFYNDFLYIFNGSDIPKITKVCFILRRLWFDPFPNSYSKDNQIFVKHKRNNGHQSGVVF